jgi:hypothetical protein
MAPLPQESPANFSSPAQVKSPKEAPAKVNYNYPSVDSSKKGTVLKTVTDKNLSWKVARKVQTFIHIRQVLSLDTLDNTFEIVFHAEFSWPDCEREAAGAITKKKKLPWTPKITFPNAVLIEDITATRMITVKIPQVSQGWPIVCERKKFRGTFQIPRHTAFHYPFDVLDMTIIVATGHSSESVEFCRPEKHQVCQINHEFFHHKEFELVKDPVTLAPAVTLEFHNGEGTHPRVYIDVKLKRKQMVGYYHFFGYLGTAFIINQMAWITFLFDSGSDAFARLVFLGILLVVQIAFHINFSQYFPKTNHALLVDVYRFISLIHIVLLMVEAACVSSIKAEQLREGNEVIWGSILGGVQFLFHCIGVCELLYAKRMENNKITHSSYYQNIVKFGPRVVENSHRTPKKSSKGVSPASNNSRSSTPSEAVSPESNESTASTPNEHLYLSSKYETA